MDGYIKDKQLRIQSLRLAILAKYSVTLLLLLFLLYPLVFFLLEPSPKAWKEKEISVSSIQRERLGLRRFREDVLVDADGGKYSLPEGAEKQLTAGERYTIVYAEGLFVNDIVGVTQNGVTLLDKNTWVAAWEHDRSVALGFTVAVIVAEIAALILIDRLWCKKEHGKIQKLKQDIAGRKERIAKKEGKASG